MRNYSFNLFGCCWIIGLCLIYGCGQPPQTDGERVAVATIESIIDSADPSVANVMSSKAQNYLWSKQKEDGSWRSENYGLLGSGQSVTPFVLHALLRTNSTPPKAASIERALQFIRTRINDEGCLGRFDPEVLDYPNYSTAFALMCFKLAGDADDTSLIKLVESYLIDQQFCEHRGINSSSPAYGGWGFGGTVESGKTGHMDLAHSRYVLQALAMDDCTDPRWPTVQKSAQCFLRMVQKRPDDTRPQPMPSEIEKSNSNSRTGYDGGFYFSPIVLRANKGRLVFDGQNSFWRSYSTATCDGALALIAAGASSDDQRLVDARNWITQHDELIFPSGIPELYEGEDWREAVFFYHLAVRNELERATNQSDMIRSQAAILIRGRQDEDGSFQNRKSALMKEDDPILCTALAVIALSKCSD